MVIISAREHYRVNGTYSLKKWHPGDGSLSLAASTAAIQAAVAAAAGKTLVIPPGDYPYDATTPCSVASNTAIVGYGDASAIYMTNVTPGGPYPVGDHQEVFRCENGTSGQRFENFRVYGDGSTTPAFVSNQSCAIRLFGVEDVDIHRVTFDRLLGFAAQDAYTAYRVNITNCTMRYVGNGLNVSAENSIQAFNQFYRSESLECAGRYSQIIGNNFKECYYGISVGGFTTPGTAIQGIVVAENLFQDITNGAIAVADGLYGVVVANNRIHKTGAAGISIASSGYNPVDRALIIGNVISSAGKAATAASSARGIYDGGTNTRIIDNDVYDAGETGYQSNFGILLAGTSGTAIVRGNRCSGALTRDFGVSGAVTATLGGNDFASVTFSGATAITLDTVLPVTQATVPTASQFPPGSKILIPDAAGGLGKQRTSDGTAWVWDYAKKLTATVGTAEATVAHGLGYTPTEVRICMTSGGTIWRSAASDGTNVKLTADAADRTADVYVR